MMKTLRWFGLVAIFLLILVSVYGYWLCMKAQPEVEGVIQLSGLHSPVEVTRDHLGVPHILAQSFDDAMFAQGYVTAQDRLWQMDLVRRLGKGELSEILGPAALETDREQRTLGFRHVVALQEKHLPPEDLQCLERYAAGVNVFIESHRDRLPIEFHLLRYQPSAWSPQDTLVLNLWMGKTLSTSWKVDLMRELIYKKLDPKLTQELLVEFSADDLLLVGQDEFKPELELTHSPRPKTISRSFWRSNLLSAKELATLLADSEPSASQPLLTRSPGNLSRWDGENFEYFSLRLPHERDFGGELAAVGSNNWVLGGSRTVGGKPLLANDPHLSHAVPSIWYMTHLRVPGALNVTGVAIAGAPGVILGHNENIAWGATNLAPDVQDLYVEIVDPQNPNRYRVKNSWQEMEIREEVIPVKGQKPELLRVRSTRHGPVIRELEGRVLSLRWTLLEQNVFFPFPTKVNSARNWEEFVSALEQYRGPAQNFVYADHQGNIGFLNAGLIPVRSNGDGSIPVPGDSDAYEWVGTVPYAELPRLFNPPSGIIITANNRIVGKSYPHFLTHNWFSPHRARRIHELLESRPKHDAPSMLAIQTDVRSSIHEIISKEILEAIAWSKSSERPSNKATSWAEIENQLKGYEYETKIDSVGASICEEFRTTFLEEVLREKLGEDWKVYLEWLSRSTFIENLLKSRNPAFLPKQFSSYESFILACLQKCEQRLKDRFKSNQPQLWRWGNYLPIEFKHPLARFWPLTRLLNTGPYPQPGAPLTIKQTSANVGVSMRMVVDFSDLDQSLNNITLGQSGQVFNPHYRDQFEYWLKGQSYPMLFSTSKIKQQTASMLRLVPK